MLDPAVGLAATLIKFNEVRLIRYGAHSPVWRWAFFLSVIGIGMSADRQSRKFRPLGRRSRDRAPEVTLMESTMHAERHHRFGSTSISTVIILLGAAVFLLGGANRAWSESGHGHAHGQEQQSGIPAGYRAGVLTANEGQELDIDGFRYRLDAEVEVTDDDGNRQDPAIMRAGDKLWFTLKKGRITKIIWIMPR